ncbi:MAG: aldehyde dehydrogenase family protein [Deltaproteobacteria bacterium]|nr:aldehyde dehydrogenase family protein [Deltaproteobacteria bacterium]
MQPQPVAGAPEIHRNFIGGEWVDARSGAAFEDIDPATGEVVGVFPRSGPEEVRRAVAAAREAFPSWSRTPAPVRGEILHRASLLLRAEKEEIARLMTREMGKVLVETRGDVQEGIDTALYQASEGRRLFGITTPSELRDKFAMTVRMPVGVAALITPWNFPIAIPSWKIFPALLCGNTVVFKPASDTPACAARLVALLAKAGVPPGVVNLVYGTGGEAGAALVSEPGVDLISFTGSSAVGSAIAETGARLHKKVSLEMGGKNGQIVMDDADLSLAVEGALWGAFGTTGQRCTATSRIIVHKKVVKEFTETLVARAQALRIGNGLDPRTQMGPLINEAAREKVHRYVRIGIDEGAKLLCGGASHEEGECTRGFFYKPTIFTDGDPKMRIAQEEIFGPVTLILPVDDLDQAIAVHNATRYGLSSSIYTRDVNQAFRAICDIEAGITYINGPTIGAEAHLPFGGIKETGNGHREGGTAVIDIFTEWKTVYIDYSGKLQKAQIDTPDPGGDGDNSAGKPNG